MKFTKEIKQQWINALRSGDFKQGQHSLYSPKKNTYCCLGVLGELNNLLDGDGGCNPSIDFLKTDENEYALLSLSLQSHLASMNDDGKSFNEIADYIEEIEVEI